MRRRTRGYTLTEIILSIAVIGLLAGSLSPLLLRHIQASRASTATGDLDELVTAFQSYRNDTGHWPCLWKPESSPEFHSDLVSMTCLYDDNGLEGWAGPYLSRSAGRTPEREVMAVEAGDHWEGFVDPWGRPYRAWFATSATGGGGIVVYSLGSNGLLDTGEQALLAGRWQGDDQGRRVTPPAR
ncbi:MAG: prepilin-type N-terminal cleavage/methylation domain-containing protein [Acidobacteriota bacterium]|nr:prepilin-type N-terminal cleavage/methylation domain-containing protein [Acidobacteriota bacterium]